MRHLWSFMIIYVAPQAKTATGDFFMSATLHEFPQMNTNDS